MVKFNRQAVQDIVSPGAVELTVTGSLCDESKFSGTDTLLVIDKGQEHTNDDDAGSVLF